MENSGEIGIQFNKELNQNKKDFVNILGSDVRKRGYESIGGNTSSIYEPTPQSLIDSDGYSRVSPDIFKDALIKPILEKELTTINIPLNKIIALDTTKDIPRQNRNQERLEWEIDSHGSVNHFRELIKEGKFDFSDTDGLYGSELPGGYIIVTGGRHRVTAAFFEGVQNMNIQVNKMKSQQEFEINGNYSKSKIQEEINNGVLDAKILKDKLLLNQPTITNPMQMFEYVPDEMINVISQTL